MYVRLNRAYGLNEQKVYNTGSGDYGQLGVYTPGDIAPDDKYSIALWVDWQSSLYDQPFVAGSVIPCSYPDPGPLGSTFTVDFYDE